MTASIPSFGPVEGMEEFNARRSHPHVAEREGDGMAPIYVLKHRHDDDETPAQDMGEHPPAGSIPLRETTTTELLADYQAAVLDMVHDVAADSLRQARAAEDGGSLAAYDRGEESGRRMGLKRAVAILNRLRDTAETKGDDDVVAAFDDLATELLAEVDQ